MTHFVRAITLIAASILLVFPQIPAVAAQEVTHRLTKDDVVKLLQGQVSPHRVGQRAREQGIDFQVTPQVDTELRRAGATDELIDTLLNLEAKTGQVAVHTAPGAEVYLDDRFSGRIGDDGRLVIADAKPGDHSIRVTLTGKKDFNQTVTVTAGQESNVEAALQDVGGQALLAQPGSPLPSVTPAGESSQPEAVLWKSIENSQRPEDFEAFLKAYPKGTFAPLAKARLEAALWASVKDSKNPADLRAFLDKFPDSPSAAVARELMARASINEEQQQNVSWLTQQVTASPTISFYFLYWAPFGGAKLGHPRRPMGTLKQSVGGLNDCTLSMTEFVDRPDNSAFHEVKINNSVRIPLRKIDESQIRNVNVSDQRDANGYGGMNGWLVILPAVTGSKAISVSKEEHFGKHLEKSDSATISLDSYVLAMSDQDTSAKAVEVVRSMIHACNATPVK